MTYTCSLCGNTYTEEIEILKPDSPGGDENTQNPGTADTLQKPEKVSGLKVAKAAANSLKFSWKAVKGADYRLTLYKGSKTLDALTQLTMLPLDRRHYQPKDLNRIIKKILK